MQRDSVFFLLSPFSSSNLVLERAPSQNQVSLASQILRLYPHFCMLLDSKGTFVTTFFFFKKKIIFKSSHQFLSSKMRTLKKKTKNCLE